MVLFFLDILHAIHGRSFLVGFRVGTGLYLKVLESAEEGYDKKEAIAAIPRKWRKQHRKDAKKRGDGSVDRTREPFEGFPIFRVGDN